MPVSPGQPVKAAIVNAQFMDRNVDTDTLGQVDFLNTTESTDKDTGAIVVEGGVGIEKNLNVGGDILGDNLSGDNSGDVTLGPVGSSANANGATLTGQVLNLEPATVAFPGVVTAADQTFAGDKTFNNNVIVNGDLTINGDLTTINTATLEVEDQNITVNKGGDDTTAEGAGLTVERAGVDGSFKYEDALVSKFKLGALGSESEVITAAGLQTFSDLKTFQDGLKNEGEFRADIVVDPAPTGSAVVLTFPSKMVLKLTNGSLSSIAGISAPPGSNLFCLINGTGGSVSILNQDSIASDIVTGTGADFEFKDGAVVLFLRDTDGSRWRMVGGGAASAEAIQEIPTGTVDGVNDQFTLTETPLSADSIVVFVDGVAREKTRWSLIGNIIEFTAGNIPALGQSVYVYYAAAPSGAAANYTPVTEFRTVSAGEITAGQLTLIGTPSSPSVVLLDVIGGTSQEYNVDYSVAGNILQWSGYTLDGILIAGSRLRIHYFTS